MDYYSVLLPLALILLFSKILTKFCERLKLPAVVGMLVTGLLIGVFNLILPNIVISETAAQGLGFFAKIGVVLIMFNTGLETDLKQIKSVGVPSVFITLAGVVIPMGLGFVVVTLLNGGFANLSQNLTENLFYGVILTATSVSVTVATLKEINKLTSKIGNTIVAAAILDDIIGIIVLSFIISLGGNAGGVATESPVAVIIKTILFFVAAILFGIVVRFIFNKIEKKFFHHRMIPILSLAVCFFFAYAGEKFFGVADITGAYIAGIILSKNPEHDYIERRSDIISYMIFTPVFFANIGISCNLGTIDPSFVLLGVCFIAAGMLGKLFGCGLAARACGYGLRDSFRVGIGMMARAEVALVCAQKGVDTGIISSNIMPFIVILIIITSLMTPICLRLSYKKELSCELK